MRGRAEQSRRRTDSSVYQPSLRQPSEPTRRCRLLLVERATNLRRIFRHHCADLLCVSQRRKFRAASGDHACWQRIWVSQWLTRDGYARRQYRLLASRQFDRPKLNTVREDKLFSGSDHSCWTNWTVWIQCDRGQRKPDHLGLQSQFPPVRAVFYYYFADTSPVSRVRDAERRRRMRLRRDEFVGRLHSSRRFVQSTCVLPTAVQ